MHTYHEQPQKRLWSKDVERCSNMIDLCVQCFICISQREKAFDDRITTELVMRLPPLIPNDKAQSTRAVHLHLEQIPRLKPYAENASTMIKPDNVPSA